MPRRIQIHKRKEIARLPENTVYCGRPTIFGNPYKPSDYIGEVENIVGKNEDVRVVARLVRLYCLLDYNAYLDKRPDLKEKMRQKLRGKNLACFCSLNQECHVDLILRIANEAV